MSVDSLFRKLECLLAKPDFVQSTELRSEALALVQNLEQCRQFPSPEFKPEHAVRLKAIEATFGDLPRSVTHPYESDVRKFAQIKPSPLAPKAQDERKCWCCETPFTKLSGPRCSKGCGWVKCDHGACLCNMPLDKRLSDGYKVNIWHIDGAFAECPKCDGTCLHIEGERISDCPLCDGKGWVDANPKWFLPPS